MAKIEKLIAVAQGHLQAGESIVASVMGTYEGKMMGKDILRTGVFMATTSRIFFFGKKMFGFETESFPYSNISSIEYGKSIMGKTISFFASGNSVRMKWINEGDVDKFMQHVQASIGKKSADHALPIAPTKADVTDEIRKFAELKDAGHITEEEFAAKKKQLLGI